jgi:hypothetical protein
MKKILVISFGLVLFSCSKSEPKCGTVISVNKDSVGFQNVSVKYNKNTIYLKVKYLEFNKGDKYCF